MALSPQTVDTLDAERWSLRATIESGSKPTAEPPAGQEHSTLLVADGSCPHIRQLLTSHNTAVVWLNDQQDPIVAVGRALDQSRAQGTPVQALH